MIARGLAYLLAAACAALIWFGASSWSWSSADSHSGYFPDGATAALGIACAFLPYWLLLKLARRFRDDPDGLLLWWMILTPVVAIAPFVAITIGLPRLLADMDTVYADCGRALLLGTLKYELVLATVYGYTGHLLLKLPFPAPRPAMDPGASRPTVPA